MNHPVAFLPTAIETVSPPNDHQALSETLELLEWPEVCEHLATFASTRMGLESARVTRLPSSLAETVKRQAETVEMAVLDDLTAVSYTHLRAHET